MPTTPSNLLPKQEDIQKQFDAAAAAGIPTYHWIPPEWAALKDSQNLPDNSQDLAGFAEFETGTNTGNFVKDRDKIPAETHPGEAPDSKSKKWPHPFSDFSHVDPQEFADEDYERLRKDNSGLGAFNNLKRIVGPESTGMQRLTLIYEWVVYRATVLLNEFNRVLDNPGASSGQSQEDGYNAARANYFAFLKDLDDHEPEYKLAEIEKGQGRIPVIPGKRGYGRVVKWVHIDPIIVNGRIQEARIIVHWNPHSSSGGVPIIH